MIPITLQQVLTHFETLARDRGAQLTTLVELEFAGARLTIHWLGSEEEALPREAYLYCGAKGEHPDTFLWASVLDPARFLCALDEGLSDEAAGCEARRLVEDLTNVEAYLTGRPYQWVRPRAKVEGA